MWLEQVTEELEMVKSHEKREACDRLGAQHRLWAPKHIEQFGPGLLEGSTQQGSRKNGSPDTNGQEWQKCAHPPSPQHGTRPGLQRSAGSPRLELFTSLVPMPKLLPVLCLVGSTGAAVGL